MSEKLLITEFLQLDSNESLLTEEEKRLVSEGETILAGVFQRAEAQNANGRVYPKNVLLKEVDNYQKLVREHRSVGELDHPDSSVIEMKNVSHIVTDIFWNGDEVIGKLKLLNTPAGNIAKGLLEGGVKFGISSRGLGSTEKKNGKTYVNNDFHLICFDLVTEPSTTGAFVIKEGREKLEITRADRINRALNDVLGDFEK
jgi:hypothetical protein